MNYMHYFFVVNFVLRHVDSGKTGHTFLYIHYNVRIIIISQLSGKYAICSALGSMLSSICPSM